MSAISSETIESAAKKGILAGVLLTVIEVTGGLISGSLGLISSAFNTLMDSVAAVIMFFAVRESSKPPDEIHMYGHGKVESVATIGEILLLFIVCSWITYNAFFQLMSGEEKIRLFWVGLGTNVFSILIDMFAYRTLKSSSKKRRSDAVEAGALHFLNDLLIAIVVAIGLVFYRFGVWYADSIAALGIVVYILYSSFSMIRNSVAVLMDAAPRNAVKQLKEQILSVEGVKDCHHIRVRRAGSTFFVDAHVEIEGHIPLNQAHSIASRIEEQVVRVFPDSDILIHTEPHTSKDPQAVIRTIASQISEVKGIHGIIVKTVGKELSVSYHLELESRISVKSAHDIANRLEEQLKAALKNVSTIISHLEPTIQFSEPADYKPEQVSMLQKQIVRILQSSPEIRSFHDIQILTRDRRYSVTLHCTVDGSTSLVQAHEIATKIEENIKTIDEKIERVTVHCEPEDETSMVAASSQL